MRSTRAIGFAASIALIAMAFVTVSSASALSTKLCRKNEESCTKANTYTLINDNFKGTFGGGFPDVSRLTMSGLATVACEVGKVSVSLIETGGPLTGKIVQWSGFSCAPNAETCTLGAPKEFEAGFGALIEATGKGDGILTVSSPVLVAKCASPTFTCTYAASAMEFQIHGGIGGTFAGEVSMTKDSSKSSLSCPVTAKYQGSLDIVEPGEQVFVTH
jgi:hypothetical protein